MSDPAEAVDADRAEKLAEKPREGFELDRAVVDAVEEAIDRDDHEEVRALLEPVHDADVADLLQNLSSDERRTVVEALRADFPPHVLAELDERVRDEVIEELGIAETVNAVRELETDDAVHIISELEEDQQELVLKAIPAQDRTLIEEALAYPDYSAGRLMRRELVAVPVFWTVGDTIDHLRATAEANPDALPDEFFDIFVVDPGHRPVGSVGLSRMLRTRRAEPMTGIMSTDLKVIDATTDQEDVAFLFLASHGGEDVFSLSFPEAGTTNLTAEEFRRMLEDSGIGPAVIVVSACHSGSFIDDIAAPDRLIITAARGDRTSFGCRDGAEWTEFGQSFFDLGLRAERDPRRAFPLAAEDVARKEAADGLTQSLPQISEGTEVGAVLDRLLAAR